MDERCALLQPEESRSHDASQSENVRLPTIKTYLAAMQRRFLKILKRTWKSDVSGSPVSHFTSHKEESYSTMQISTNKDPHRNNRTKVSTSPDEDLSVSVHFDRHSLVNRKQSNEKKILQTSLGSHLSKRVMLENANETGCPLYTEENSTTENQSVTIDGIKNMTVLLADTEEIDYPLHVEENCTIENQFVSGSDKENLLHNSNNEHLLKGMALSETESESTCEKYRSCRWTLAYLVCLMSFCVHCLRTCMSMAIVCIREVQGSGSSGINSNKSEMTLNTTKEYIPKEAEGAVLSSYFYGYLVTPFIFSVILARMGVKHVMSVSMATSAALTLLTPAAIRHSLALTLTVRALLGVMAGGNEPSATILWVFWAPQTEKAKLMTLANVGSSVGILFATLVSGFLCSIPLDERWPTIFYAYGTMTALWVLLWQWTVSDRPETHPRISTKELLYIQQHRLHDSLKPDEEEEEEETDQRYKPMEKKAKTNRPPWKCILTSVPFLSLLTTHVAYIWINNFLVTYLPLYVSHTLRFNTQLSGVVSSLPFLSRVLTSAVFAVLVDRLHSLSLLSVSNNRKLFQTIGLVVPSTILCGMGYLSDDEAAVVVLIVVVGGLNAACISACRLNYMDLSPRYAGTLTGISQTFSSFTQILATTIISYIVQDGLQSSWVTAFVLSGVVGFVGAAVFLAFGSGDRQPWG